MALRNSEVHFSNFDLFDLVFLTQGFQSILNGGSVSEKNSSWKKQERKIMRHAQFMEHFPTIPEFFDAPF